jgi:thioredoxin reductase/polyferredoxin
MYRMSVETADENGQSVVNALPSTEKGGPSRAGTRRFFATVPPQEILPIVSNRFESSVRGIYVIGDVTGLPLVKVAANQGVAVMAGMAADGLFGQRSHDTDRLDLVIIGGGPAGLSAAIEAEKLGLRYVVLERNRVASTVRSFPPGKMVYAEPQFLENTSALDVSEDLEKDEFLTRIQSLVEQKKLKIKEDTDVLHVRRHGERQFDVETKSGKVFPARLVLVAIGRQGQPRLLTCPGADDAAKVTYRLHTPQDYNAKKILIVGGGNSAIESALLLMEHNQVTLSYRGDDLFRAKEDNRRLIEQAAKDGLVTILYRSNVTAIRTADLDIDVNGNVQTIANDNVIVQIGTLPPVPFLMDMGLELDGVWTARRVVAAMLGLVVGFLIYFAAKYFVLRPDAAGDGLWLIPGLSGLDASPLLQQVGWLLRNVLPAAWVGILAARILNTQLAARDRPPLIPIRQTGGMLVVGAILYGTALAAPTIFTLNPADAGPGPYYLPGLSWIYAVVPTYFTNLYGFYYLAYFSAITGFGLYWAWKSGHRLIWRRNLIIIVTQWTLWWGIPTFLALFLGRNAWTPLTSKLINAWPLNTTAFRLDPLVTSGDPAWWHTVAVVGVLWAVFLTFVVIPLFTIRWGKIYCSYICSCGALAETVGNGYRHRGPKGDVPRKLERLGFVFIALVSIATVFDLMGFDGPFAWYNVYVGTAMSGAIAVGLYPFLGQRIWCRMWCPLAFWMNFWGRWSKFRITPEKGKCIDCNVCNQYCQMGIDIKSSALQGKPITLESTPCVGCAECVVRCPMEILHLGDIPGSAQPSTLLPVIDHQHCQTPADSVVSP